MVEEEDMSVLTTRGMSDMLMLIYSKNLICTPIMSMIKAPLFWPYWVIGLAKPLGRGNVMLGEYSGIGVCGLRYGTAGRSCNIQ